MGIATAVQCGPVKDRYQTAIKGGVGIRYSELMTDCKVVDRISGTEVVTLGRTYSKGLEVGGIDTLEISETGVYFGPVHNLHSLD
jgi:hypothetical protein